MRQAVQAAVSDWEATTCLRFPEVSGYEQLDYVIEIINGSGCWSYIGELYPVQQMSLRMTGRGSGCMRVGYSGTCSQRILLRMAKGAML